MAMLKWLRGLGRLASVLRWLGDSCQMLGGMARMREGVWHKCVRLTQMHTRVLGGMAQVHEGVWHECVHLTLVLTWTAGMAGGEAVWNDWDGWCCC